MKKIAICGYTSSVGKRFLEKYKDLNIIRIGRKEPDIYLDFIDEKIEGDMEVLNGCDALVNFAAVSDFETDYDKNNMLKVNISGPLLLAELANKYQIPYIIHVSSISARYDKSDNYYGYYSITKKTAEDLLELYCEEKQIGLCILEPTALYGDQTFGKHQKLLYSIINQVRNDEPVILYGQHDAQRNYLNVDVLCKIIRSLVERNVNGKYIVANMKNMSLTEIVDSFNAYYEKNSSIHFCTDKTSIGDCVVYDEGKIYDLVGMEKPEGLTFEGL